MPVLADKLVSMSHHMSRGFDGSVHTSTLTVSTAFLGPRLSSSAGIVATTQFRNRVFDCPTDSNANLAQCDGDNVLAGLGIDGGINVGAYFGGLLGLVAVLYTLSCFVLWVRLSLHLSALRSLTS